MDSQIIILLSQLVDAHSRLADNVGRIADALQIKPDDVPLDQWKWTLADQLTMSVDAIGSSLTEIAEVIDHQSESGKNEG